MSLTPEEQIEAARAKRVNGAAGPTAAEPLRGLTHLSKVALLGREKILERAAAPVAYVWQDIAVASTIVVISGKPGEGKTTLLFLLLAARADFGAGVSVLGRQVTPAPHDKCIVLVEGEHGEGSTCRKLVQSCALQAVDDIALGRIIVVARKAVRLDSPEWQDIKKLVAAGLVSDIAIDTLARVAPADPNDEREQVRVFDTIAATIDAAPKDQDKPLVWIATHNRKSGDGGLDDVSGSAQRTGQADTVVTVRAERVGGQVVSSEVSFPKLREDPDDYPMPVTFSIVRDDTGQRHLRVNDVAQSDPKVPIEDRIIGLLQTGPKSKTALVRALKRNAADIETAISKLFAERLIQGTTITVRGNTCKAFELRPQDEGHVQ